MRPSTRASRERKNAKISVNPDSNNRFGINEHRYRAFYARQQIYLFIFVALSRSDQAGNALSLKFT